ncbi:MAG: 30S ribosomal protein S15 [Nanoarchaeota archaeon]|nr:30S ribosomal protein S15 [Nanoarchaeota archaeon]MBU1005796.1 30S ribosomal protein S15 [Nanoarchaeota archaeon]MBU1946572.1 30S ribosomal protein S15 [Nanoarchaeota archaeon]
MARMYSRKRGTAGSHRPATPTAPSWMRYKEREVEMLIMKLAKEGNSPSKIGVILRDTYGIPSIKPVIKKSITKLLEEKKLLGEIPEDLLSLIKRIVALNKHKDANNRDQTVKRGIIITESKIRKLIKYYKGTGKLPSEWKYDSKRAGMFTE